MGFMRGDKNKLHSKAVLRAVVYELDEGRATKEESDARIERIWASYTTRLAAMGLVPPEDDEE